MNSSLNHNLHDGSDLKEPTCSCFEYSLDQIEIINKFI